MTKAPTIEDLFAVVSAVSFGQSTARVPVPDVDVEWQKLRAQLPAGKKTSARKRPLAPVIWFGTSMAAAAALALAYFGQQSPVAPQIQSVANAPVAEAVGAEYVEAGDANASTMVYVDKDSGWLVVWATDPDTSGKG